MKTHWISRTVALTALFAGPAAAGVVFEIEVKDHDASAPMTTTAHADGRNIKMNMASGNRRSEGEMIYRGDRREMIVVDHDSREYMVIDEETIREIGGQVSNAMAQMQEALKNVPAEQRAMVEQMMKRKMPQQAPKASTIELRNTGERATHNGYPCVRYDMLGDGRKQRELWVTDWDNVEGGDEAAAAFEDMAGFIGEMLDAFPKMGTSGGGPGMDDNMFAHFRDINGFPIVTRELAGDGSIEGESTLRSSKRQALDPSLFEPPAGYKRREMYRP